MFSMLPIGKIDNILPGESGTARTARNVKEPVFIRSWLTPNVGPNQGFILYRYSAMSLQNLQ